MHKYYFSSEIAKLINPPLRSKYLEKQKVSLENLYHSQKRAPLGRAPQPSVPSRNIEMGFGSPTVKGISVADLLHPSEDSLFESMYCKNFSFQKPLAGVKPAGIKLEKPNNSEEQMKEIFNHNAANNSTVILPSSHSNRTNSGYRENITDGSFQPENRECTMDKNKDETKVEKIQKNLNDRHLVEAVWNLLKKNNHENFKDLISSFQVYKNGNDKITLLDLQNMCHNFGISVPLHILEKLLEECEIIDTDGALSYEEFIHSLHWKDMLPENRNFKTPKYANDWKEGINNPPQDIMDNYITTSSFIGDHKYAVNSRVAGLPSHGKNISRVKLKGVSEFNEHGDASSVIQPNAFLKYGVFEDDLKELHSKEKIKQILQSSGIRFSDTAFETVWQNVSEHNKASIGKVWYALKEKCLKSNIFKDNAFWDCTV